MMRDVIFHTLRGQSIWYQRPRTAIDVARVLEMHSRARWFVLIQKDLPYELHLKYELPRPSEKLDFAPTINVRGQFGVAFETSYEFEEDIILRYKNEHEARQELEDVILKQSQLKAVALRLHEAVRAENAL